LCGRRGGGPGDFAGFASPTSDQWSYACRGGDPGTNYPYGPTYQMICNGNGVATAPLPPNLAPAGDPSATHCRGSTAPYDRIIDQSGNAAEWEDACDGPATSASCRVRGGDYRSSPAALGCDTSASQPRDTRDPGIGIRCCYGG
jgi:formylglycine-generating enzyme required for sulfatase activity